MKIEFDGAQVRYGSTIALAGLDVAVPAGEWLGLVGPSGSGKTSALRAAAGFEPITAGRITLGEAVVADGRRHLPPEKRGPGFVFQEFALFPHLSVADNVAFGLRRLPRAAREQRVRDALERVELAPLADRAPGTLSGGQQQRVALARALAPAPPALLMDEPFGSLDPGLRSAVRRRVAEALRARGCTVIFISHDIDETFALADRVAILRGGVLQQVAPPEEAFTRPANAFVAGFLGPVDLLPGDARGAHIDTALGRLTLARPATGPRLAVVRPHRITVGPTGAPAAITERIYRGHEAQLTARTADGLTIAIRLPSEHPARPGDTVHLSVPDPVETVAVDPDPG